jgi:hypothetical protein
MSKRAEKGKRGEKGTREAKRGHPTLLEKPEDLRSLGRQYLECPLIPFFA